jgi:hypothetical protein
MRMRVLSDEIAFLAQPVRDAHLFVQLRHRWKADAIGYGLRASLEVAGEPLEQVPPTVEALAARTGEKPQSNAHEAARGLIIWATGGLALLSKRVTGQPTHVQLLALLGPKACKRDNCENLQLMFAKPEDETAPAALVLRFDFLVEDAEGVREQACAPDNELRVDLPPGATLAARLDALFAGGKLRVLRERLAP